MPDEPDLPDVPVMPVKPRRRLFKLSLAVLGTVVIVGVPSAVALYMTLNRAASDELVRMVPADADVYATLQLDPSLSQKRNLYSFLQHFPQLRSQQAIQRNLDSALNDAFKGSGFDFTHDVQPWLGSQIGVAVWVAEKHTAYALLARTSSESGALKMLAKSRSGSGFSMLQWTTAVHDGVTVANGRAANHPSEDASYAVFDGVAAVASTEAELDAVIDTAHGHRANLGTQQAYKDTLVQLPGDRIFTGYVNAAPLIGLLKKELMPDMANAPQYVRDGLAPLDAYRTVGAAVSAQSDAMALDTVMLTDPAKLPAKLRQQLSGPAQHPSALGWVPQDSYALFATSPAAGNQATLPVTLIAVAGLSLVGHQVNNTFTNVSNGLAMPGPSGSVEIPTPDPLATPIPGTVVENGLEVLGTPPPWAAPPPSEPTRVADPFKELGITGPDGIASHLTGDTALFVRPSAGKLPVGAAAVIGTDDSAAMEKFLHKLGGLLGDVTWTDSSDGSAVIHSATSSQMTGLAPAYAVVDGFAVVGTDAATVRAAIDAHRGSAPSIASAAPFRSSGAASSNGLVVFLDFQRILTAIETNLSSSDRADFDNNAAPDLKPLRTLVVTTSGDASHQTMHLVVTAGG